jgi:hypothetical protein
MTATPTPPPQADREAVREAVATERELCAKAAEGQPYLQHYRCEVGGNGEEHNWHHADGDYAKGRFDAARAIRARAALSGDDKEETRG